MKMEKKATAKVIIENGNRKIEHSKHVAIQDDLNFRESINIIAGTKEGQYILNRIMDKRGKLRTTVLQNAKGKPDLVGSTNPG